MGQRGPFWNRRIALAIAVVSVVVFTSVLINGVRDDALVFVVIAFPVGFVASISHAITNRTFFFVPWKTYRFTVFERWAFGIAFATILSAMLATEFLKNGQ